MTHSPASSEDEERRSASECPEGGSESDSSPDGPGTGPQGTRGRGSGGAPGSLASAGGLQGRSMSSLDDAHFSMMVFRIGIPDLHQTVSGGSPGGPPPGPACPPPAPQTRSGPPRGPAASSRQKCLRFNPDATIWTAKQQVLCALSESLQDVLNYGLFQPAASGRDANFLEEERLLREYPQSFEKGVPYLEVSPSLPPHTQRPLQSPPPPPRGRAGAPENRPGVSGAQAQGRRFSELRAAERPWERPARPRSRLPLPVTLGKES